MEERASATTAIVAIVILVILAMALYFGFFGRGGPENVPDNGVNVELNGDMDGGASVESTV